MMPAFLLVLLILLYAIPTMADEAASWPRADPNYQIRFPQDKAATPLSQVSGGISPAGWTRLSSRSGFN
jgi:hypothetical protein